MRRLFIVFIGLLLSLTRALLHNPFPLHQQSSRFRSVTRWGKRSTTILDASILPEAVTDRTRSITDLQVSAFRGEDVQKVESVFRKYPFHDANLPVLQDVNNYYSGVYNDLLWHQNGDQVFVFIPVTDDTIHTSDISVKIAVTKVDIKIRDKLEYSFSFIDKVIPDGSFWMWEKDKVTGQRYIQLDLEKRFRVINWKSLFVLSEAEQKEQQERAKSELFQQFMGANKGLAKLTGKPSPSEEELLKDLEFMSAIDGVPEKEMAVYKSTEEGSNVEIDIGEMDENIIPFESYQDIVDAKRQTEGEDSVPTPSPFVDDDE